MTNYYRKKPVVIQATLATGTPDSNREIIEWTKGSATPAHMEDHPERGKCLTINTLEGAHWVAPGDYVIKGAKGEFYPCKPDIFAMTYEAAVAPVEDFAPHQQRVVQERTELADRSVKLQAFFPTPTFADLPEAERSRLRNQARFMDGYLAVLEERIAAF